MSRQLRVLVIEQFKGGWKYQVQELNEHKRWFRKSRFEWENMATGVWVPRAGWLKFHETTIFDSWDEAMEFIDKINLKPKTKIVNR